MAGVSGCTTYRPNCGKETNSRLTMADEPAKVHEGERAKFEQRRYVVSVVPVPESAPPQDVSLVQGKFPSVLDIQLHPGTELKRRQWKKCPEAGQVVSQMTATIVDSQGKRTTVTGTFTTADAVGGLATHFVAPVDAAALGIEYTLREPNLAQVTGSTLRITFGQAEGQVGTITANVQRKAQDNPESSGYSTAVDLLALKGPA